MGSRPPRAVPSQVQALSGLLTPLPDYNAHKQQRSDAQNHQQTPALALLGSAGLQAFPAKEIAVSYRRQK